MQTVVNRVTTPLSPFQMGEALIAGHRRYFGTLPSKQRLSVAWAHCALEHARGDKLYNFNFGNVTASASYDGDVYVMHVPPPDPPVLRFRSFEFATYGAIDYWTMLDQHYRPALSLFDTGRAFDASHVLGSLGYFTDDPQKYARAVVGCKEWFDLHLASSFDEELSEGRGNSILTQDEIDETLRRIEASNLELRNRKTDPEIDPGSNA